MSEKKRVVYLTSSHYADDDRIYYHIKSSLEKNAFDVSVCSSFGALDEQSCNGLIIIDGSHLSKKEKITWFYNQLRQLEPDLIICGEPLPILAAKNYKKKNVCKIIYDVTEWYPSKKNIEGFGFVMKYIRYAYMFLFNLYASFFVDGFMIGEYHKRKLYDVFFRFKPKQIISYYSKREYISLVPRALRKRVFKIGYSGRFSKEKGIHRVFKVADALRSNNPGIDISLSLIGKTYFEGDALFLEELRKEYSKLVVKVVGLVPFHVFSRSIVDFDVALDLRDNDWENTRCLPIKVFHYNGCGIPVVYSALEAIKKGYVQASFCKLVMPDNTQEVVDAIQEFIDSPAYYNEASTRAVETVGGGYVWECIEPKLISFIDQILIDENR